MAPKTLRFVQGLPRTPLIFFFDISKPYFIQISFSKFGNLMSWRSHLMLWRSQLPGVPSYWAFPRPGGGARPWERPATGIAITLNGNAITLNGNAGVGWGGVVYRQMLKSGLPDVSVRPDPVKLRGKSFVWSVRSSRTPLVLSNFNLNYRFSIFYCLSVLIVFSQAH